MSDHTEVNCRLETPDLFVYDYVCNYPHTSYGKTQTVSRRRIHFPQRGKG